MSEEMNETEAAPQQALPQQLYLMGGGRHRSTRLKRRANRFPRRAYHLGGLVVRPNRRVAVDIGFIVANAEEITARIWNGTLIVQHDADRFVDPNELAAIVAVAQGLPAPGPMVRVSDDEPEDLDTTDRSDDTPDSDEEPEPADATPEAATPVAEPEAPPAAAAEEVTGLDEAFADEPEPATDEAEPEPEPDMDVDVDPDVEPEATGTDLDEMEPAQLRSLCDTYGIEYKSNWGKAKLIKALRDAGY